MRRIGQAGHRCGDPDCAGCGRGLHVPAAADAARPLARHPHGAALEARRRPPRSRDIAGRRRGHRRRDLRHPAFQGIADADLDARDRPGARRHHRRRRQGHRLRRHLSRPRSSSRRLPFGDAPLGSRMRGFDRDYLRRAAEALRQRQARARRDPQQRPSGAARTARSNWRCGTQHPRAQRPHRPRRRDPAHAAELFRRRQAGARDGGRARRARARRASPRLRRPARRIIRLCDPERGARTRSRSTSAAWAATSRPIPSPICAPASRKATAISSAAPSTARSCCSAPSSISRTASSPRCACPADMTERRRHDAPCPRRRSAAQKARSDIAGVFVHATAVRNLIEHDAVTELGFPLRTILTIVFAAIIACAACLLAPGRRGDRLARPRCRLRCRRRRRFVHALALPADRARARGSCGARADDRLPLRDRRPRRALPAQELCALSRARGDRQHGRLRQDAGARRRDAQRHHVLLGSRRLLLDRRER